MLIRAWPVHVPLEPEIGTLQLKEMGAFLGASAASQEEKRE
jgi:hypothetical protein